MNTLDFKKHPQAAALIVAAFGDLSGGFKVELEEGHGSYSAFHCYDIIYQGICVGMLFIDKEDLDNVVIRNLNNEITRNIDLKENENDILSLNAGEIYNRINRYQPNNPPEKYTCVKPGRANTEFMPYRIARFNGNEGRAFLNNEEIKEQIKTLKK